MTLTFKDQVLARPVPLEHDGKHEIKDIESMQEACKKLDTLPIYYGLRHGEVDRRGGISDAIGRARNLRVNRSGQVVGDVELDVLPEALAKKGDIGWSLWFNTEQKEGDLLKAIMWKHVLATPNPLDTALKTPLNMGYMVGESQKLGGSAELKRVNHPTTTHKENVKLMPDDAPKPDEKPPQAAPKEEPTREKAIAPTSPPAVDPTVEEARREIIEHYREQLKGTITDEALKLMPLKALKAQWNAEQKKLTERESEREPEHPAQPRRGLPARPAAKEGQTYAGTDISDVYSGSHGLTSDQLAEQLHAKFRENFPHTGPIIATGQGEYSNVPPKLPDVQKERMAREARKREQP